MITCFDGLGGLGVGVGYFIKVFYLFFIWGFCWVYGLS